MKNFFRVVACAILLAGLLPASTIGYFNQGAANDSEIQAAITASGNTPIALADLSAGSLSGISVLWMLNQSNLGYGAIGGSVANLDAFVLAGGALVFNDRYVAGAAGILPGGAGIVFHRDFTDAANINIVTTGTMVTNGPGGVLTDTSLDNGNFSSHGFADLSSLPSGAVPIFSRTDPTQIVDFSYELGSGYVYYSSIPVDYYLSGFGNAPPRDAMVNTYAPNELAYASNLGIPTATPEPGSFVLAGLGLLIPAVFRLRKKSC